MLRALLLLGYAAYLASLHTQNVPGNIGAQFFAANLAVRGPLDDWAVFSGNLAAWVFPLIDGSAAHAAKGGKGSLRPQDLGCLVHGVDFFGLVHFGPV